MDVIQKLIDNQNNFTNGRKGNSVQLIVLHSEGARKIEGMADRSLFNWFQTNGRGVSAHYYVTFSGKVEQYVRDEDTAHQAGNWQVNLRSIGIEHQDNGFRDRYTDAEYEAGAQLVATLCKKYEIPAEFVAEVDERLSTGITIHKNVGLTACPAGLDWMRIINRVKEILETEEAETLSFVQPLPPDPRSPQPQLKKLPWGVGVNMRELAYYGWRNFASAELNTNLDLLDNHGVKTVRFFASRIELTASECADRVEATLNELNARGMNAIVCLTDAFSESGFVINTDAIWHKVPNTHGQIHKDYWLQRIYRDKNSYLEFARTLVSRLRSHPAVAMWELGNEFAIHPQPAAAPESEAFLRFVEEAAGEIKSIDGNTPVSIGLVNSTHVSPSGVDPRQFTKRLYTLVDAVSIHRYGDWSQEDQDRGLLDMEIAQHMGKDFYAGEIGMPFSSGADRVAYFTKEIEFWHSKGAFSAMPWQFNAQQFGGMHEDMGISKGLGDFDALLGVLKTQAV